MECCWTTRMYGWLQKRTVAASRPTLRSRMCLPSYLQTTDSTFFLTITPSQPPAASLWPMWPQGDHETTGDELSWHHTQPFRYVMGAVQVSTPRPAAAPRRFLSCIPVLHQNSLLHSGLSPQPRLHAPFECGDWKQTEYSRHSLTSTEEKELFTASGHTAESTASVTFTTNSISRPKWFIEHSFTVGSQGAVSESSTHGP